MKQLLQYDIIKKSSHAGLLCNQTAWHVSQKNYSFRALIQKAVLKKVFIPEHGLFGELQDQEKPDTTTAYNYIAENIEWISLYSTNESSLTATANQLT